MSKDRTFTFRIEWGVRGQSWTSTEWETKRAGTPNDTNLDRHVARVLSSFAPGGINNPRGDMGAEILSARIVRQSNGATVAEWKS